MSVLGTKLHPPSPRRRLVQRARITDQLRAGAIEGARLVLVAAPAGFGKTTLLAQWLAAADRSQRRVAWLALDPGDADLRLFLTHLVAAIQTVEPEVGVDALSLLEGGGPTPPDAVLVSLINDLDVLAGPTVVALDDYHVIDTGGVHEAVTFLLDNLPPQVTLAMTTRADPPLPLSRLRARGDLVEVRAADLRFTADEAEVFLNEVMGLQLESALVARLEARTEGWAAGLQLAALSARAHAGAADGSGDVVGFVEAFSGSHRFIVDYLVEEVLDRQPDEVRAFLLDTSLLDHLTAGLCDALTGRSDGQSMLEILERENLFVVPLDDERRWYRYHHLFAEALRVRLAGRHGDRVAELHAAASRWLAENGLLDDAVRHAIASGDHERTADLVELTLADMRRHPRRGVVADLINRRASICATAFRLTLDGGREPWRSCACRRSNVRQCACGCPTPAVTTSAQLFLGSHDERRGCLGPRRLRSHGLEGGCWWAASDAAAIPCFWSSRTSEASLLHHPSAATLLSVCEREGGTDDR
jgi:LuxR family maltose regulon positive regulatory protein